LALDEPKETDTVYDIDGFSYLVDKEFIEKVQPIKVDFVDIGFRLSCAVDFSAGSACSGCGSASNCG
jgi:iron-sulfur cluster assembly protein